MEEWFKIIDYAKNLLFYSTTEEQEKQAKRILKLAKHNMRYLYVN